MEFVERILTRGMYLYVKSINALTKHLSYITYDIWNLYYEKS